MPLYHYVRLRWSDGFSTASELPPGAFGVRLEGHGARCLAETRGAFGVFASDAFPSLGLVWTLVGEVYLHNTGRRALFQHSIAARAPLSSEAPEHVLACAFERLYGREEAGGREEAIAALYAVLSQTTYEGSSEVVRRLFITAEEALAAPGSEEHCLAAEVTADMRRRHPELREDGAAIPQVAVVQAVSPQAVSPSAPARDPGSAQQGAPGVEAPAPVPEPVHAQPLPSGARLAEELSHPPELAQTSTPEHLQVPRRAERTRPPPPRDQTVPQAHPPRPPHTTALELRRRSLRRGVLAAALVVCLGVLARLTQEQPVDQPGAEEGAALAVVLPQVQAPAPADPAPADPAPADPAPADPAPADPAPAAPAREDPPEPPAAASLKMDLTKDGGLVVVSLRVQPQDACASVKVGHGADRVAYGTPQSLKGGALECTLRAEHSPATAGTRSCGAPAYDRSALADEHEGILDVRALCCRGSADDKASCQKLPTTGQQRINVGL